MKKIVFICLSIVIVFIELLLALTGPMATMEKPTAIVAPVFTSIEDTEYISEFTKTMESVLVRTGSFSIVKQTRFDDYFLKYPDKKKEFMTSTDYLEIAKIYEIKKLVIIQVYEYPDNNWLHVKVLDTTTEQKNVMFGMEFENIESLSENEELSKKLTFGAKTISFLDMIYLFLLVIQVLAVILYILKINIKFVLELFLIIAMILFLMSFFYAKNANMDYFQKFVATKGQVTMAADTQTEQLYIFIRFLPLFLINIIQMIPLWFKDFKSKSNTEKIKSAGFILTFTSAVLYTLSFPNNIVLWGIPVLGWIALVPLFLVLYNSGITKGIFYGICFGALQAILINFWQGTYSFMGLMVVGSGLVIEYVLFMLILIPCLKLCAKINPKLKFFALPVLWLAFEYIRSIGFLGYPWALSGQSQFVFTPFIQIASVAGIWGVCLIVLFANAAVTWIVQHIMEKKSFKLGIKTYIYPIAVAAVIFVNTIGGLISLYTLDKFEKTADEFYSLLIIQQNTDPRKHEYSDNLSTLFRISDKGITEAGETPDLVIWAEGGFPPDLRWWTKPAYKRTQNAQLIKKLKEYITSRNINLLTGTTDHTFIMDDNYEIIRKNYNSAGLLHPDGSVSGIYHKMHLVPFTEHFPYKKELPKMWEFLQKFDTSNWLAGSKRLIMETDSGLRLMAPICFEDAFPDHIRRFFLQDADLIANISNDYWSLSPVEGLQHGINGLFRAVENRRPMLRSTSSGYTVFADAAGRIKDDVSDFYAEGYIIVSIPKIKRPLTFYTKHGDWLPHFIIILCFTSVFSGLLFLIIRKIRKKAVS